MRIRATLCAFALLLAAGAARADETPLFQIPTDKLCTKEADGRFYLDSKKLWAELIGRMVRSGQLPLNEGGDSGHISLTYSRATVARALWDDLADFHEHLSNTDYRLVSFRRPSAADIRTYPELGVDGGYLLFPRGRYAVVLCTPPPAEPVVDKNARPLPKVVLRVRGDPADLRNELKEDSKPATFSITDDFEKTVTSFQIDGSAGIGVSGPLVTVPSPIGGYDVIADGQIIGYGRLHQKGADNVPDLEIDNKALGLVANIDYGRVSHWENSIALVAAYTWDDKVDSEIESGRLLWTPRPAWPADSGLANWWLKSFRGYATFSLGNRLTFEVRNKLSAEAVYANAVEAGTDPLFQDDKTYFQAGANIGTSISWVNMDLLRLGRSEGLLQGMTVYAQYKWLDGITGPLETFERFEAGVTFLLGKSNKFGWTTKYINGRLDDTLQEVDYVESALSLKF